MNINYPDHAALYDAATPAYTPVPGKRNVYEIPCYTCHSSKSKNRWSSYPKDDDLTADDKAYSDAHPGDNLVSAHGLNGMTTDAPSSTDLQSMGANGNPTVVGNCYGGATGSNVPGAGGSSVAGGYADQMGANPSNVYGCTGTVDNDGSNLACNGTWVNAQNPPQALSSSQMMSNGLENCSTGPNGSTFCATTPAGSGLGPH